jgi:hypothetical protein
MALVRAADKYLVEQPKPARKKHKVTPIVGEFGRYMVDSHSMAKRGKEGAYIVDVLEREETNAGVIIGTCACKGWSVRKTCSHLEDAREEHARILGAQAAEGIGFENLDSPPVENQEPNTDRPDES